MPPLWETIDRQQETKKARCRSRRAIQLNEVVSMRKGQLTRE